MVFTGIVEEMGEVVSLVHKSNVELWDGSVGDGWVLTVLSGVVLDDAAYLGCSIAVNGTCLTATRFDDRPRPGDPLRRRTVDFGLSPETLRRTNLGDLVPGSPVNLERSMAADGRNSGHVVQGHVDGTGAIVDKWVDGDSLWIRVRAPADILASMVAKGYIAVDGTSLTVVEVNRREGWFTFMLVEYTQKKIIIPAKPVGARVNLEPDVLGKYASTYLRHALADVTKRLEAAERTAHIAAATACILGAVCLLLR